MFLDSVQFEKQSWQSRNRIRTPKGDVQWLSVPIRKEPLATPIKAVEIAPNRSGWRQKQMKTIRANLDKAPFYTEAENALEPALETEHTRLADMSISFIQLTAGQMGLQAEFVRASDLPVAGSREELLLNLCEHFGSARYYSNAGSAAYLEEARPQFEAQGVELVFQEWEHPIYQQQGKGFVSHLSVIDVIAAVGCEGAAQFLKAR